MLTDREKGFIRERVRDDMRVSITPRPPRFRFLYSPWLWLFVVCIPSVLVWVAVLFVTIRVDAVIGVDNVNMLIEQASRDDINRFARNIGVDNLSTFVDVFSARWLIAGGVTLVSLFFVCIIVIVVYATRPREE